MVARFAASRLWMLSLGLAACGGDGDPPAPSADLPALPDPVALAVDETGPFAVGYRTWEHRYESPAGTRTIALDVWYPTEAPSGEHPVYALLFEDEDVYTGAPLGRSAYEGGFPVLVHSHGSQGFGGNSSDLMHHFASHGWVAIAPNHTDNLLLGNVEPRPTRHYFERPLDVRQALDALRDLPAGDPLAGRVDLTRVAMTGHSFGVYTTWASAGAAYDLDAIAASCEDGTFPEGCTADEIAVFAEDDLSEPRVTAFVGMAGGPREALFGTSGYNTIDAPYLLMTGSADPVGADTLYGYVDGIDFTWVDVEGGCHQLFGLGGCDEIADDVGFAIVNTYALAFARYHTLGDRGAQVAGIVVGTDAVSPRATFTKK